MRALRKEPQHRYNSIEQLASDVRRYLTREPVQARQGNWLYYSQRFVRRHAFGVTAGAAFVVFLVAFAHGRDDSGAAHRRRSATARNRKAAGAEKVSDFMLDTFAERRSVRATRKREGKPGNGGGTAANEPAAGCART